VKNLSLLPILFLLFACQPAPPAIFPTSPPTAAETLASPTLPAPTPTAAIVFPENINPLTGLPVEDSSLLKIPAVLVSISHFPATARPQSGLSFAPFVYEIYITEGATRFLAVFYGEFPEVDVKPAGECAVRTAPFKQTDTLLGNRVWLEETMNGTQDAWEDGIGGVCVNLYDAGGNFLRQTSTDSNGYYGFNVQPGRYVVEFIKPNGMEFTGSNLGDENADSDADQLTGRTEAEVSSPSLFLDAGLLPSNITIPPESIPLELVGPIRSGRLVYGHIAGYFRNSCLIYAFASPEVLEKLPQCYMVFHQYEGGGYMLDIPEMRQVARANKRETGSDFDYASNLFSSKPLANGAPASQLQVYIAYQNQSAWAYDPLSEAYIRYVDTSEYDQAGILHADTDRLTGRQLRFENLIVLFAGHEVISPTNLDIHLEQGRTGEALLLRDGQVFKIQWSTKDNDHEQLTGMRHPIQFFNSDGTLAALKPGHTWILVATPSTTVTEESAGKWTLLFTPPVGAK